MWCWCKFREKGDTTRYMHINFWIQLLDIGYSVMQRTGPWMENVIDWDGVLLIACCWRKCLYTQLVYNMSSARRLTTKKAKVIILLRMHHFAMMCANWKSSETTNIWWVHHFALISANWKSSETTESWWFCEELKRSKLQIKREII